MPRRFVKQPSQSAVFLEELNFYASLFCRQRASNVPGFGSAVSAAPRADCLLELPLEVPCQSPLPCHIGNHRSLYAMGRADVSKPPRSRCQHSPSYPNWVHSSTLADFLEIPTKKKVAWGRGKIHRENRNSLSFPNEDIAHVFKMNSKRFFL